MFHQLEQAIRLDHGTSFPARENHNLMSDALMLQAVPFFDDDTCIGIDQIEHHVVRGNDGRPFCTPLGNLMAFERLHLFHLPSQCGCNAGIQVADDEMDAAALRIIGTLGRFCDTDLTLQVMPAGLIRACIGDDVGAIGLQLVVHTGPSGHGQDMFTDEDVHGHSQLPVIEDLRNVVAFMEAEMRAPEHGKIDFLIARQGDAFQHFRQIIVRDRHDPFRILTAKSSFFIRCFRRESRDMVHVIAA